MKKHTWYKTVLILFFVTLSAFAFYSAFQAPTPQLLQHAQSARWQPAPGMSWQWQLTGKIDQSVDAQVYNIDLFDNDASTVSSLHAKGRKVICYMSAGTFEDWRSDASKFPSDVKGNTMEGWPGEKWLDIRNITALGPLMKARLDQCKAKGFDGVEFDNVDAYTHKTGFPLTAEHQIAYNKWLAAEAQARGLAAGLKNDLEQVPQLVSSFDFLVNEQCFQYNECSLASPFVTANKAVFVAEYNKSPKEFCPKAKELKLSAIKKNLKLDAYREACSQDGVTPTAPASPTLPTTTTAPTLTKTPTEAPSPTPTLTIATPTLYCLGSCPTDTPVTAPTIPPQDNTGVQPDTGSDIVRLFIELIQALLNFLFGAQPSPPTDSIPTPYPTELLPTDDPLTLTPTP